MQENRNFAEFDIKNFL